MLSMKNKMKIILKILFMKKDSIDIDISELVSGYKIIDNIKDNVSCDNHFNFRTNCKNNSKYCLSRTFLRIKISLNTNDHVHLCESCSYKLLDKTHDFR